MKKIVVEKEVLLPKSNVVLEKGDTVYIKTKSVKEAKVQEGVMELKDFRKSLWDLANNFDNYPQFINRLIDSFAEYFRYGPEGFEREVQSLIQEGNKIGVDSQSLGRLKSIIEFVKAANRGV